MVHCGGESRLPEFGAAAHISPIVRRPTGLHAAAVQHLPPLTQSEIPSRNGAAHRGSSSHFMEAMNNPLTGMLKAHLPADSTLSQVDS